MERRLLFIRSDMKDIASAMTASGAALASDNNEVIAKSRKKPRPDGVL